MITIAELKKKSLQRYNDFLTAYLLDTLTSFFPLVIPGNKGSANDDIIKREAELREIHKYSKNNGKKAYLYTTDEVNTRKNGKQTIITQFLFEDQIDYLYFIEKTESFSNFKKAFSTVSKNINNFISPSDLNLWAVKNNGKLSNKDVEGGIEDYWSKICLCANWLKENPDSNLYLRMIPLEVHSKFIESNENIIHSLLSDEKITKANSFIKQHNLHDKPSFIRFRFLDNTKISSSFSPKEMYLTENDFALLNTASFMEDIKNIYVVENEMIYLTFPKVQNSICIWGHGFTAGQFKKFSWLKDLSLYYFGDLDEHGYDILSIFRGIFPNTKSLAMDINTLNTFSDFRVKGEVLPGNFVPENLTKEEYEVFYELRNDALHNRLEQERISQNWIEQYIKNQQ